MFHEIASRSLEVLLIALVVGCTIWVTVTATCLTPCFE
jgi:hypothetical protein